LIDSKAIMIMKTLLELYYNTPKHYEGRILGSMTTQPHPLAVYAYTLFIHTNYSDPVIFNSIKRMEEDLINDLVKYYGGEVGFVTSGGTESNIVALLSAWRSNRGRSKTVIAPDTVHVSIDKACVLMDCKLVKIPTGNKPVDPSVLRDYVKKYNPFAIVITAGTTEMGLIDPVKEVAEIAVEENIYLHVDASYGGLLIPHLYKHGYVNVDLRFYPGVSSIVIDFHKNGLSPIPSSVLLFSSREYMDNVCFEAEYTLAGRYCGLLGTRPGGAVAATWTIWKYMDWIGYENLALRLINTAYKLYSELSRLDNMVVYKPILPIIAFKHRFIPSRLILEKLLSKRIYVYRAPSINGLRIVVMPHINNEHVDVFIRELTSILNDLELNSKSTISKL